MRRIAVIGSNSFSGSDFVDLLLEDPETQVIGMSRSPEKSALFLPYKRHGNERFAFHEMDFNRDLDKCFRIFSEFRPECVVNFACQSEVAPSWDFPWQWFQTNAVALSRFADELRKAPYLKRYLHFSSPEVYGSCRNVTEDAPVNPTTPYAASRAAGDLFLFTLVKHYRFPMVMVRATNVYGKHQQLFKIIPRSVIRIKQGTSVDLHGGGRAVKSYIHIRDVSRGTLDVLERGNDGEIYHLSPDDSISVKELVGRIASLMKIPFDRAARMTEERPGQDSAYIIDSSKARRVFGWAPGIPLGTGLKEVIEWIETNWAEIQRAPLEYIHKP